MPPSLHEYATTKHREVDLLIASSTHAIYNDNNTTGYLGRYMYIYMYCTVSAGNSERMEYIIRRYSTVVVR